MGKPWARYEVGFIGHDKFRAIPGNAICLWLEGKNYADAHSTDGLLPAYEVKHWRFYSKKNVDILMRSCGHKPGADHPYAPLWVAHPVGFQMHDYLDHNDCREEVLARIDNHQQAVEFKRDRGARRQQLFRDKALRTRIRVRDGGCCRYCGRPVDWSDKRSPAGATYDHVDPNGPNSEANLVVACRGCNSTKRQRTPTECGMALLPPQTASDSSRELKPDSKPELTHPPLLQPKQNTENRSLSLKEPEREKETSLAPRKIQGGGAMAGMLPKDHLDHTACGRVCLLSKQGAEFAGRLGGPLDAALTQVRTWAEGVLDEWDRPPKLSQPIGGSTFQFWQARFIEWQGPAPGAAAIAVDPYKAVTGPMVRG